MTDPNRLSADDIRQALARRSADPYVTPIRFSRGAPRPAAVLLPLLRQDDAWRLLFIHRTMISGDRHSGQVAFPGGHQDPSDAGPDEAALREAREEVGLAPEGVQLLGHLEDMVTITNYRVTPVVGLIPWPFDLRPAPSEVQRIFTIPLAWLADPANRELRQRRFPLWRRVEVIYFSKYDGELLWGVSARITLSFLSALGLA